MLTWVRESRDYWRSRCRRFDLTERWRGSWVAIDGAFGRVFRCGTKADAERWCEARFQEFPEA